MPPLDDTGHRNTGIRSLLFKIIINIQYYLSFRCRTEWFHIFYTLWKITVIREVTVHHHIKLLQWYWLCTLQPYVYIACVPMCHYVPVTYNFIAGSLVPLNPLFRYREQTWDCQRGGLQGMNEIDIMETVLWVPSLPSIHKVSIILAQEIIKKKTLVKDLAVSRHSHTISRGCPSISQGACQNISNLTKKSKENSTWIQPMNQMYLKARTITLLRGENTKEKFRYIYHVRHPCVLTQTLVYKSCWCWSEI